MANTEKEYEEFVTCLCLIFGAIHLLFFSFLGLIMAVMTISFGLPLHFFKAFWVAKSGELMKFFFAKVTIMLLYLPQRTRKHSTSFSNSNLYFVSYISSILSANTDPLVCDEFVVSEELKKCFLYFFLKSLFFAMLGILSTLLFL